mgnify:CR=1 FL=1
MNNTTSWSYDPDWRVTGVIRMGKAGISLSSTGMDDNVRLAETRYAYDALGFPLAEREGYVDAPPRSTATTSSIEMASDSSCRPLPGDVSQSKRNLPCRLSRLSG